MGGYLLTHRMTSLWRHVGFSQGFSQRHKTTFDSKLPFYLLLTAVAATAVAGLSTAVACLSTAVAGSWLSTAVAGRRSSSPVQCTAENWTELNSTEMNDPVQFSSVQFSFPLCIPYLTLNERNLPLALPFCSFRPTSYLITILLVLSSKRWPKRWE